MNGLIKHLTGRARFGGHDMAAIDAQGVADQVFAHSQPAQPMSVPAQRAFPTHAPELLADPYASFLIQYFQTLVAHKLLPKYQFERRIDAIITMFLPGLLKQLRGWRVEMVMPEFPLKKPTGNDCTNADCLLFRHGDDRGTAEAWVLFELKTDDGSCDDDQLGIDLHALKRGMPRLLAEVKEIASSPKASPKFSRLAALIERHPVDRPVELVYLSPRQMPIDDPRATALTFKDLERLNVDEFPRVWDLFRVIVLPHL